MVALKVPMPGTSRSSTRLPVGKHRAALLAVVGRIEEFQHDLRRREGHPVQLEVAGFLHLTIADRHMGDDGFLNIGLPDTHHTHAVFRDTRRVKQTGMNGKRTDTGRQVAAVAAPVDEGLVDGDLAVEVVDVVVRLAAARQDHALAGAGGGAAHAVDVRGIGVGAADHAHEQPVARLARHPAALRQVLQAEEHALAGPATHVGGWNLHLGYVGHGSGPVGSCRSELERPRDRGRFAGKLAPTKRCRARGPGVWIHAADDSRKSLAKRCSTPPALYTLTSAAVSRRQVTGTRTTSPLRRLITRVRSQRGEMSPSTS